MDLDRDAIAWNPMLTGRFQLAAPGEKLPSKTAVVLGFGARGGPRGRRGVDARRGLAARRRRGSEVRYRDPTQMGKVYLLPAGIDRTVPGLTDGEQGPDADDPSLTLDVWRERIRRHPGELKNLLKNQAFVAGIGNAYSDEILHAARLLPFRKRSSLAPEEVDALYAATRTTLATRSTCSRERVPPTFEKQVRDFLAVHDKGGQAVPALRHRITEVRAGRIHHVVLPRLPALTRRAAHRRPRVERHAVRSDGGGALARAGSRRGFALARGSARSRTCGCTAPLRSASGSRWGLAWPWAAASRMRGRSQLGDSAALGGGEARGIGGAPPTADRAIHDDQEGDDEDGDQDGLARWTGTATIAGTRLHQIDGWSSTGVVRATGRGRPFARPGSELDAVSAARYVAHARTWSGRQAQPALLPPGKRRGRRHRGAAMVAGRRRRTPGAVARRDVRALKRERHRNGCSTTSRNWWIDRLGLGQRHGPTG